MIQRGIKPIRGISIGNRQFLAVYLGRREIWNSNVYSILLIEHVSAEASDAAKLLLVVPQEISQELKIQLGDSCGLHVSLVSAGDTKMEASQTLTASNSVLVKKTYCSEREIGAIEHLPASDRSSATQIMVVSAGTGQAFFLDASEQSSASKVYVGSVSQNADFLLNGSEKSLGQKIMIASAQTEESVRSASDYKGVAARIGMISAAGGDDYTVQADTDSIGMLITIYALSGNAWTEHTTSAEDAFGTWIRFGACQMTDDAAILSADPDAMASMIYYKSEPIRGETSVTAGSDVRAYVTQIQPETVLAEASVTAQSDVRAYKTFSRQETIRSGITPAEVIDDKILMTQIDAWKLGLPLSLEADAKKAVCKTVPDETGITTELGLQCENNVIVELVEIAWEYPTQTQSGLSITQVCSAVMDGNKLIIN